MMCEVESFHDYLMLVLVGITFLVGGLIMFLWSKYKMFCKFSHSEGMETIWTLGPIMILALMMLPSISLIFLKEISPRKEEEINLIKVMGRQWYWEYESPGDTMEENIAYESFLGKSDKESIFLLTNLDVDKPLNLPLFESKVLATSGDVIHSFAVPSLGMKVDCVPGRLNQTMTSNFVQGVFFGQCSEICGANHSFMPICVQVIVEEHLCARLLTGLFVIVVTFFFLLPEYM